MTGTTALHFRPSSDMMFPVRAQRSPQEGADSIAWNVEHKEPAALNGKLWRGKKEASF